MGEIHGKWEDRYERINDLKEEIIERDPRSIVLLQDEDINGTKHFKRFFMSLYACSSGFLAGCRPYLGLDGCHLKGKYMGVMIAATTLDGNNGMFPVAFGVVESENAVSWEWFLEGLKQAIGMPKGLVLASDRQKGLEEVVPKVYPLAEHRRCMRHLYKNFKKKFPGDLFERTLWIAPTSFSHIGYALALEEIQKANPDAYAYVTATEVGIWSRSFFGIIAKCHYITNNLSESFNAWIVESRHRPVPDLLDAVRTKIMVKMQQRRSISTRWKHKLVLIVINHMREASKGLGEYKIDRSTDFKAEVSGKGARCEVILNERRCTCRRWQVSGIPCMHALAFLGSIRGANLDDYVDEIFSSTIYKAAYAYDIAPLPDKSEWVKIDLRYKLMPPVLHRSVGRPKKKRIRDPNEPTKRLQKCKRC